MTKQDSKASDHPNLTILKAPCRTGMSVGLLHSLSNGTPFKFDLTAGDLTHTLVLGSTGLGMTINPVAGIGLEPDQCLRMLQRAADYDLDDSAYAAARKIALDASTGREPTVRDLVGAWKADPNLIAFAEAVAKAMLPA